MSIAEYDLLTRTELVQVIEKQNLENAKLRKIIEDLTATIDDHVARVKRL
jgi:phage gp36-like protein